MYTTSFSENPVVAAASSPTRNQYAYFQSKFPLKVRGLKCHSGTNPHAAPRRSRCLSCLQAWITRLCSEYSLWSSSVSCMDWALCVCVRENDECMCVCVCLYVCKKKYVYTLHPFIYTCMNIRILTSPTAKPPPILLDSRPH
jgi:hypothetical protein